jgi:hypothetical protein
MSAASFPASSAGKGYWTTSSRPHLALSNQAGWVAASSIFLASKLRPRARTLQAMRASLLASAIASTLWCSRFLAASSQGLSPWRSQLLRLVVDYGDGVTKIFDGLAWSKGNTVLDVLNRAQAHPHGITFVYTGDGMSAFLTKIDGLQNQGGGSGAKNWQYWVNTTDADRSFAVFEVQALDTVFWRFAGGGK